MLGGKGGGQFDPGDALQYTGNFSAKIENQANFDQKSSDFRTIITNLTENCAFYAFLTRQFFV